jgi:hypothetical protein
MSKCILRQTHTRTHADCDRLYRMLVFSFILQKLLDEIGHHVTVVRTIIPLTNIPSNFIFSRSLKCVLRVVKMCSTDRQSFLVDRGLLWIDPKIKSVPSVPSVARVWHTVLESLSTWSVCYVLVCVCVGMSLFVFAVCLCLCLSLARALLCVSSSCFSMCVCVMFWFVCVCHVFVCGSFVFVFVLLLGQSLAVCLSSCFSLARAKKKKRATP